MKGFAERHLHAIASAKRRLLSEPITHCLTILVIALSLAVPSTLYRIISDAAAMARGMLAPRRSPYSYETVFAKIKSTL